MSRFVETGEGLVVVNRQGAETFHLQGQHDQQTHAGGRAVDPTSPAARRGWKPLKGVLSERPIEFDDYENRYRMTAANGQQIEAAVFTGNAETNEILRSPVWKQRIADGLNGVTDGYDLAPTDGLPPHIIVIDELPFGLPDVANQANAFVASRNARGPVPFAAPFSGDQLQSNTVVFNATAEGREMWDVFEERAAEIMMPSVSTTSVAHYTGIHEYGHTRATEDGTPLLTQMYRHIQPKSLSSISPEWKQLSRYGKSNAAEAHAETFADFVLTDAQPTNAATVYYSSILGWGSEAAIEEALAAAAGATKLADQWVWFFDSPNGGTLITKAADGADFGFDPSQPRDETGKWTSTGAGSVYSGTAAAATEDVAERARQGLDPSEFDGPLMSRGIAITVDDDLKRRLDTQIGRGADPSAPDEFNQHLELGPEIAEQLLDFEGHQDGALENTAGFGQSWTTRESVAESVHPGPGQNLVVKVVGRPRQSDVLYQEIEDADGRHAGWVDADGNSIERGGRGSDMIPGEMEVRVDGRSPVDIVDIQVRQGNRWESVWGDERGFGAGADELYRQFPHVKDWDLAVEVFHLQGQHDQSTHGNRAGAGGAITDEFMTAPGTYIESAQAEWTAAAAYMAENEMPAWWKGTEYIGEDGLPVGDNEVGQDWESDGIVEELDAFKEQVGPEVAAGVFMIGRAADARRKEAIGEAISMNDVSVEEANARYGRDANPERGEWQELPDVLYHATSALDAIEADGALKTRREIGGRDSAAGLGGGPDSTISFTSDRAIADGIARSLHEVHRAVNTPIQELHAEIQERAGGWYMEVVRQNIAVHGVTEDSAETRYNLYRTFASVRERQEGILDPLFFNVNAERLRDMDPGQIGVVEVVPAVTGAKGYQVSALGEWRTPTGAVTEITRYIQSDPVDQFTATVEDMRLKVTRTTLASEDPTSLLAKVRSGGDLTETEARIVVDWVQSEVLDGDETPEEALVKLIELPIGGGVEQFHANHDQSTHGNRAGVKNMKPVDDGMFPADRRYRAERSRRAGEAGRAAAAAKKAKNATLKTPAPQPLIEWRKGNDTGKESSRGIAEWFKREFMPTGEVDVGDMLLAFLTLPGRILMPDGDQERLLLAAQGMRVFHLQGQHDQQSHAGGRAKTDFEPITAAEARGNSRPVTSEEFQRLAAIGQEQIDELAADSQPIDALDDESSWEDIQNGAFGAAQESWGGATINARTGEFLASDADRYALTVKEPGMETVTVPEDASQAVFEAAMTEARDKFRPVLERRDHYLGVFHDDDLNRIDFDPVTVVDSLDKVETIGAATRAIGGAYNFADGNGYWPPHVDEDLAVVASASMDSMEEKTSFKGPAEWKRQAKQLEGAPDAAQAPKKARKFRVADPGR